MFELSDKPRLFGIPPGVDFPKALVDGLHTSFDHQSPDALARVQIIVNTRRMARRIRDLFDAGPACLLPRITLITSFGETLARSEIPPAISTMRRHLELSGLVRALLDAQPGIAPRSSLFDLTQSLSKLMDEMHSEGVLPSDIAKIDTGDQSGHWERIKAFLDILKPYFETGQTAPDFETRQRLVIERVTQIWRNTPPEHPVLIAGSTGSRGATRLLMKSISRLPQGAAILPGFDFDQPENVWNLLMTRQTHEDHPQFRYARLLSELEVKPRSVAPWSGITAANRARTKLVSLALRPAPVTDQWLTDASTISKDLQEATRNITLLEAPSTRIEALAIAMRLRQAAEDGVTAALITPDRTLTRQVSAALARWHVLPDDSAGIPLHQTASGRFLRHVAETLARPIDAALLLTILKHPLCHSNTSRGDHLRFTRELELFLRRDGPPFPTASLITSWAGDRQEPEARIWADWLVHALFTECLNGRSTLQTHVSSLIARAEKLSLGSPPAERNALWEKEDGQEAWSAIAELRDTVRDLASVSGPSSQLDAIEFASLLHNILSRGSVRATVAPHPNILIWGTLEARVQGADLLILAGLNEGTWPERPEQDPWMSRAMRKESGLLLPERRIGLAAHDFQQALCHENVWLTRSMRSDDAQSVPSRWLNRLSNLLPGISEGEAVLTEMHERGNVWLAKTTSLEKVVRTKPAPRPSPAPPVAARPRRLSVSQIDLLLRDPYAIYARHVLRLKPLDPLMRAPDHLLRGIVLHEVMQRFIERTRDAPHDMTVASLCQHAAQVLEDRVPWGAARAIWLARITRVADWIVQSEANRRQLARPAALEETGTLTLGELGFTMTAKADRIDLTENQEYLLYDYKTGAPPSKEKQKYLQKQLLLEALIAEEAGFSDLPPGPVLQATYIGLGTPPKEETAPLDTEPIADIRRNLVKLLGTYLTAETGFTAQRAAESQKWDSPYDHLARRGEWDLTDPTERETLT